MRQSSTLAADMSVARRTQRRSPTAAERILDEVQGCGRLAPVEPTRPARPPTPTPPTRTERHEPSIQLLLPQSLPIILVVSRRGREGGLSVARSTTQVRTRTSRPTQRAVRFFLCTDPRACVRVAKEPGCNPGAQVLNTAGSNPAAPITHGRLAESGLWRWFRKPEDLVSRGFKSCTFRPRPSSPTGRGTRLRTVLLEVRVLPRLPSTPLRNEERSRHGRLAQPAEAHDSRS